MQIALGKDAGIESINKTQEGFLGNFLKFLWQLFLEHRWMGSFESLDLFNEAIVNIFQAT